MLHCIFKSNTYTCTHKHLLAYARTHARTLSHAHTDGTLQRPRHSRGQHLHRGPYEQRRSWCMVRKLLCEKKFYIMFCSSGHYSFLPKTFFGMNIASIRKASHAWFDWSRGAVLQFVYSRLHSEVQMITNHHVQCTRTHTQTQHTHTRTHIYTHAHITHARTHTHIAVVSFEDVAQGSFHFLCI
jgi:hypothetical protein